MLGNSLATEKAPSARNCFWLLVNKVPQQCGECLFQDHPVTSAKTLCYLLYLFSLILSTPLLYTKNMPPVVYRSTRHSRVGTDVSDSFRRNQALPTVSFARPLLSLSLSLCPLALLFLGHFYGNMKYEF